jgi:TolB-like protein
VTLIPAAEAQTECAMAEPAEPSNSPSASIEPLPNIEVGAPPAADHQRLWQRLKDHRVVQWTLAYAAVAYTVLHATEMVSEALEWPHWVARVLTLLLLLGAPVVMALSWYHGIKSPKKVSGPELAIIALLLFISGSILWLFSGTGAERAAAPVAGLSAPAASGIAAVQAPPRPAVVGSATSTKPRIAVLPFENLSLDPNNAFFTEGLHEEILTALANGVPGLQVISRTTMNTYKDKQVSVEELAKELNCTYVLEGSVRREGEEVRLTVQLIDARDDSHVWAENYDRKLVKAMTLESEVAGAVASRLSIKVGRTVTQPTVTTDPRAYDLYLKARAAEDSAAESGAGDPELLLNRAISLDPAFVRAYAERIAVRVDMFLFNQDPDEAKLTLARRDLDTVKTLAPDDPVAITAQAIVSYAEMDYARALELFGAAESAGLSDPRPLDWKSRLLFAMGRYQEATALTGRLAELDPKNEGAQVRWQFMLMELHQGREALQVAELGLVRNPGSFAWQSARASVHFEYGGNLEPYRKLFDARLAELLRSPKNVPDQLADSLYVLNLEHRYDDGRRLIDTMPADILNQLGWDWPLNRIGLTPFADLRGWQDLLLGDVAAARRDGERVFKFLGAEPETKWNKWYRAMLRADAQLFTGDKASATRTAKDAVTLTRAGPDKSDQSNAYVWATQIMAWTGADDDAAVRLESLATSIPGLWPGEIAYTPLWTVPLAQNGKYKQLRDRLISQLKLTKLE